MTTTFVQSIPLLKFRRYSKVMTANTPKSLAPDAAVITTLSATTVGSVVTGSAACAAAHNLVSGDEVTITGVGFAGVYIVTVTDATHFTFRMVATASNVAGTFVQTIHAQAVLLRAAAANTHDLAFGPTSDCDFDIIGAGGTYNLPIPARQKINLADMFASHSTDDGAMTIFYV